jgi:hypothetical protein
MARQGHIGHWYFPIIGEGRRRNVLAGPERSAARSGPIFFAIDPAGSILKPRTTGLGHTLTALSVRAHIDVIRRYAIRKGSVFPV